MRALLLAAALAGPALAAGPSAPRVDFSSFTLANGLRVIVSRDASTPVVAVATIVDVGGRREARGRSGFAHLFEHMMFEGSEHAPKGSFDKLLESVGGDNNAETDEDYTLYYEVLPSNALAVALWLDADRIGALSVTGEAMKNQIAVVEEEKRQRVDDEPYGPAEGVEIASYSFSNWQNAHPTIGSFEDLDAATLSDVRAFFRAYYSPDNLIVAVVGDADPAEVRALMESYYGGIPAAPRPPDPDFREPPPSGEKTVALKDAHAKLPALAVTWKGMPARGTKDACALTLLGRALLSGKSARLYNSLVKGSETAVSVSGGLGYPVNDWDQYKEPGLFGAFVVRKRGAAFEKVKGLIAAEAARAAKEGLSPAELERVKVKFRSDWVRGLETRLGRATSLLQAALLDGDPREADRALDRYLAVTPDDVRRAAAAYLKPEAATWFDVAAEGGK